MKENKIHRMFGHPLLYVSILSLPGGCVFGTHAGAGKKVDPAAGPKTETKTKKAPPTKKKAATTKPVVGTAGAGTGSGGGGSTPPPVMPTSTGSSGSHSSSASTTVVPSKPKTLDELIQDAHSSDDDIIKAVVNLLEEMGNRWPNLDPAKQLDLQERPMNAQEYLTFQAAIKANLAGLKADGDRTGLLALATEVAQWRASIDAPASKDAWDPKVKVEARKKNLEETVNDLKAELAKGVNDSTKANLLEMAKQLVIRRYLLECKKDAKQNPDLCVTYANGVWNTLNNAASKGDVELKEALEHEMNKAAAALGWKAIYVDLAHQNTTESPETQTTE